MMSNDNNLEQIAVDVAAKRLELTKKFHKRFV